MKNFLETIFNKETATDSGTAFHKKMQFIIIDEGIETGAPDLIQEIKSRPELLPYFVKTAKTEVPIAGNVDGKFYSMRIDRLLINDANKNIVFIDYKTDSDKTKFIEHYKEQFKKYTTLLKSAYPEYSVVGYILWKQDWTLDKII
ncbi:MAG: hypothetical protein IKZ49_01510 [Alphaproteobacteria bacterium]|nr:hypothetical protein [Alphaproteobacteria bacterium]